MLAENKNSMLSRKGEGEQTNFRSIVEDLASRIDFRQSVFNGRSRRFFYLLRVNMVKYPILNDLPA